MAFLLGVTFEEAAQRLDVSLDEVRRRVNAGTLTNVFGYPALVWLSVEKSEMPVRKEHLIPEKEIGQ